jgi:hypothetical protein
MDCECKSQYSEKHFYLDGYHGCLPMIPAGIGTAIDVNNGKFYIDGEVYFDSKRPDLYWPDREIETPEENNNECVAYEKCVECSEKKPVAEFVKCHHLCLCVKCCDLFDKCPVCFKKGAFVLRGSKEDWGLDDWLLNWETPDWAKVAC